MSTRWRVGHRSRTWMAIGGGLVLGMIAAFAGMLVWNAFGPRADDVPPEWREAAAHVDLFRLPSGDDREMFLVPAGPDASGEPRLAQALFPGEDPPRELASLMVANVSPDRPWDVDLAATPLSCRRAEDQPWTPLQGLSPTVDGAHLAAPDLLRLRSLGGSADRLTIPPRSMQRVLVALPPRCRFNDLSGVQWGDAPLVRDRLDLERIRRFREDPAAVTMGR